MEAATFDLAATFCEASSSASVSSAPQSPSSAIAPVVSWGCVSRSPLSPYAAPLATIATTAIEQTPAMVPVESLRRFDVSVPMSSTSAATTTNVTTAPVFEGSPSITRLME